jgi:hypothetical protein
LIGNEELNELIDMLYGCGRDELPVMLRAWLITKTRDNMRMV